MTATHKATEFATDLGEKLKQEAEKLHALELVTRPLRKPEPKKKSKLGMLMVLIVGASAAYAIYRKVRGSGSGAATPAQSTNGSSPSSERSDDQRLVTSGL